MLFYVQLESNKDYNWINICGLLLIEINRFFPYALTIPFFSFLLLY